MREAAGHPSILLAAGGTGGHLFPAQALAGELGRRGWAIDLVTDHRADKYGTAFPARSIRTVASATLASRSPIAMLRTGFRLARGVWQSWRLIGKLRPKAVVGFGGYPTFPPIVAARISGTPAILHEQNAVMGRANRMLAGSVRAIATSFPEVGLLGRAASKAVHTGNPVREPVIAAMATPYPKRTIDDRFRLLVFGGSQGARYFSELMPELVAALPDEARARLDIVQQCRPEDIDEVGRIYKEQGIAAELMSFFTDMPARIAAAHLVICRSGASSIAELTAIGRPAILVPLPHALDQDQKNNARFVEEAGGGWIREQNDIEAVRLANEILEHMNDPACLEAAAGRARALGTADAASRLADLVERIAGKNNGDAA